MPNLIPAKFSGYTVFTKNDIVCSVIPQAEGWRSWSCTFFYISKIIPKFHLSTDIEELELTQKTVLTTEKPVKIKMFERQQ